MLEHLKIMYFNTLRLEHAKKAKKGEKFDPKSVVIPHIEPKSHTKTVEFVDHVSIWFDLNLSTHLFISLDTTNGPSNLSRSSQ